MDKNIITFGSLFFIFQMQIMQCSYFTQFFTSKKNNSDEPQKPNIQQSTKKRNCWVDLTSDDAGNVFDKTADRFVTFCTTPEVKEIDVCENSKRRSIKEHVENITKKRAASLASRIVLDQANPQRRPRSHSCKTSQTKQTDSVPAEKTQPHILHITLKRCAPK